MVHGGFCYERNREWGQPERLFVSSINESVRNPRPYVMLTEYLIQQNRCAGAIPYLESAVRNIPNDAALYVSWGRALQCVGDREQAMKKLQKAAALQPDSSQVFQLIGLLYGEMKMPEEAAQALRKAVAVAPNSTSAHNALGIYCFSLKDLEAAEAEFRKSAALDAHDRESRAYLAMIEQIKSTRRVSRR
jgi:Flp pilus assembly protein TadD